MFKDWVLDASKVDEGVTAFMPYDEKTGEIVFGLTIITDVCPGRLVGVVHDQGQEAVEEWVKNHLDWYDRFKNPEAGPEGEDE